MWSGPISQTPAYDLKFSSTILVITRRFAFEMTSGSLTDVARGCALAETEEASIVSAAVTAEGPRAVGTRWL